jgi:hypothetical protein
MTAAPEHTGPIAPFRRRWFAAWVVLGALIGLVFAAAFASLPLLPFIAAGLVFLLARGERARGAWGALTGAGLPLLLVAYLNRHGPGEHCTAIPGGEQCAGEWSPWPWLVAGLLLIAAGLLAYRTSAARSIRNIGVSRQRS